MKCAPEGAASPLLITYADPAARKRHKQNAIMIVLNVEMLSDWDAPALGDFYFRAFDPRRKTINPLTYG
jgi:hypothetical protein